MMLVFVHVFYPGCALICFLVSGLPCAFLSGARFFGGLVGVVPLRLLLLSLDFSRNMKEMRDNEHMSMVYPQFWNERRTLR
ncbi:hypothetical protein YC2023_024567 [Brassica napus]